MPAALLCALAAVTGIASAEGMVTNEGFEEGAAGWGLPQPLYAIDDTVAHSGTHSLKYHNEPGGPYLIAGQGLPLKVGKCYRMGAWVRTEGIASTDTGATISMEWSGKQGYVGGSYPLGIAGTTDWRQIVFVTGPVPEGVIGGGIIAYGRPGTSGTAWFDDLEVAELDEPLARLHFADLPTDQPRKQLLVGLTSPEVRVVAELSPTGGFTPDDLTLTGMLHFAGAQKEITGGAWRGGTAELVVPTDTLPLGETQIEASLVSKGDNRPVTSTYLWIAKRRLLSLAVTYPNSPGVVGVGRETDERLAARVSVLPQGAAPQTSRARLVLMADGKEVGRPTEATVTDRAPSRLAVPLAGLPYRTYDLRCDLFARGSNQPLACAEALVTHANPAEKPANATWIGPNRMLMVQGKPFIPLGFYILSSFETVLPSDKPYRWQTDGLCPSYYVPILDRLSKSHFNCVMDYGSTLGGIDQARAFLDAALARGVRAIFSVKDLMKGAFPESYVKHLPWQDLREATHHVVGELRTHPSVIAWYINDEVTAPDVWPGAVNVFRDTRATDPWHPTWAVHYDYERLTTYREACDIIGTDPYTLIGDINFAARDWHASRAQMPPEQPFWAVVQCFGPGYEFSRPEDTREPTFDEERAATMAAIAEGATGIIYYCYHSLQRSPRFEERFAELDRVAAEVRGLEPIIALPDADPPVRVEQGTLSALTKRSPDGWFAILASTLREDQDVVLRLPRAPKRVVDRKTGEQLKPERDRLTLRFRALDARVLEVR